MNKLHLKVSKNGLRRHLIVAFGLALLVFGAWAFWQQYRATHNPNPELPTGVVTNSTDKPDETPITKCPEVSASTPRKIRLPSLDKSGCIQKVGVDQENKIAVPTNIHVGGWFVDSPPPGEKGVSVIDGHVQGYYEEGIFKNISQLDSGQKIVVKYGDGGTRQFEVASVNNYPVEQASQEQFKQLSGIENQLTLITCGGNFDPANESYDQRIIVRAKLL